MHHGTSEKENSGTGFAVGMGSRKWEDSPGL